MPISFCSNRPVEKMSVPIPRVEIEPHAQATKRLGYWTQAVGLLAASASLRAVRAAPQSISQPGQDVAEMFNTASDTMSRPQSQPQLHKRANFYRGPLPTNENLLGLNGSRASLSFAAPANVLSNPGVPPSAVSTDDPCTYEFIDTIGGFTNEGRVFRNLGAPVYDFDVMQGSVPDCGFGAGVLALIANGDTTSLSRALVRSNADAQQPTYRARFLMPDAYAEVAIDDNLPNAVASCGRPLLSYQAPEKNYYVPLLEMAWAKYIDAYPQFRVTTEPGAQGYLGLTGTAPRDIMRGVTGRRRQRTVRKVANFDQTFANAIILCLNGNQGCAVRTPVVGGMPALFGKANANGVFSTSAGQVHLYDPDEHTYTLSDKDQGNKDVTLATDHWYAIRGDRSPGVNQKVGYNTANTIRVTLTNPWGCNPDAYSSNACATDDADVVLSLRATWTMFNAIDTLLA